MDVANNAEPSAIIRQRVVNARAIQQQRFNNRPGVHCYAHMRDKDIYSLCSLDHDASRFLLRKLAGHDYPARAYSRILKLACNIVGLAGTINIQLHHVGGALHYRNLEKFIANTPTPAKMQPIISPGYPFAV